MAVSNPLLAAFTRSPDTKMTFSAMLCPVRLEQSMATHGWQCRKSAIARVGESAYEALQAVGSRPELATDCSYYVFGVMTHAGCAESTDFLRRTRNPRPRRMRKKSQIRTRIQILKTRKTKGASDDLSVRDVVPVSALNSLDARSDSGPSAPTGGTGSWPFLAQFVDRVANPDEPVARCTQSAFLFSRVQGVKG